MKLSVIVPVFNERETILAVLKAVHAHPVPDVVYEVIVIDDGSRDGTGDLLETRPELYTQFVRLPRNGGKGAAVKAGLAVATGDYVLFQDADLEYSPADYAALLRPVLDFNADVVVGSRFLAPRYTRVHYFWHLVGNRLLTLCFNILFNSTFTDIYSCYLLYRRSRLDPAQLRSQGWEQHAEILCSVTRPPAVIYEVPVGYSGRTYGEGKKIHARHAIPVFMMILRKRFEGLFKGSAAGRGASR